MKAIKTILGLIRQADQTYNLFSDNDRIMIGVSGGKDSMVLAYAINIYQKFNFAKFTIVPAILDLGFDGFDASKIKEYFASLNLDLKVIDAKDVYPILKAQQKEGKTLPCSICSRMKKAAINKVAKMYRCNKVAFAHHADDAIETLLMNQIYGGRIATFQPKMHLERSNIDFIRPLIHVRESDIIRFKNEENIPVFSSCCPNDGVTKRTDIKELLNNFYDKYPSSKDNFLTMLTNYQKEQLFYTDISYKIERTPISFKPIILVNDAYIENDLINKIRTKKVDLKSERFIIYFNKKPIGLFSYRRLSRNEVDITNLALLKEFKKEYFAFLKDLIKKEFERRIFPLKLTFKGKPF